MTKEAKEQRELAVAMTKKLDVVAKKNKQLEKENTRFVVARDEKVPGECQTDPDAVLVAAQAEAKAAKAAEAAAKAAAQRDAEAAKTAADEALAAAQQKSAAELQHEIDLLASFGHANIVRFVNALHQVRTPI